MICFTAGLIAGAVWGYWVASMLDTYYPKIPRSPMEPVRNGHDDGVAGSTINWYYSEDATFAPGDSQ